MSNIIRPRDRDGFDIAIVCALPLERDAVRSLFEEEYELDGLPYTKILGDPNAYTLGRLGGQHVVLVHMLGMGVTLAAAAAVGLRTSFRNLKVVFIVGICGGVPVTSRGERIHLGDVIVSVNAVRIGFGRQYPNRFAKKLGDEDTLQCGGPDVRAFWGKVCEDISQKRLQERTSLYIAQTPSWPDGTATSYPGIDHDICYIADYRHKHRREPCEICDACNDNGGDVCESAEADSCNVTGCKEAAVKASALLDELSTVDPNPVDRTATKMVRYPAIHFGRIACGDVVMRSGWHRDELAKASAVIAFEMESAGVWEQLPTIIVKGVSDYADSHKDKLWQPWASATAASCTKAILEEWRSARDSDEGV